MALEEEQKQAFSALVSTIRTSSQLAGQDIGFFKTLDDGLLRNSQACGDRLLDLANRLIQVSTQNKDEVDELENTESITENWRDISSVLDGLFEKTDIALDQLKPGKNKAGIEIKTSEPGAGPKGNMQYLDAKEGSGPDKKVVTHSKALDKPQVRFKRPVNNSLEDPFKPLLTSKPNALVPLEESVKLVQDRVLSVSDEDEEEDGDAVPEQAPPHYTQPYEYEIINQMYPKMDYEEPEMFHDWKTTSFEYVDTKEALDRMISELEKSAEIAVDLEHHDYRSFHGFVCLMQISNRNEDWVVDTLALREELEALNKVFTNPAIVKVFHGAFMDIMWLQRDFGLYIVSLFDTHFASKALGLKRGSLSYLLETYANFKTSKKYQLADWRVRPIPEEMLAYARADTHFLLYIFDVLRNELLDQGKLEDVLNQSRDLAKKRYEIPGYGKSDPPGWKSLLVGYSVTPSQEVVMRDLFQWRDRMARKNDESPRYIMPNHYMAALSFNQPTTVASVLGVSNGVTPFIRNSAKEIARIIEQAKEKPVDIEVTRISETQHNNDISAQFADDEKLEENFEMYKREYRKASNSQNLHLFNSKLIASTMKQISKQDSELFGRVMDQIDQDSELTTEFVDRKDEVRNELNLYVPLPPLGADPYGTSSEESDEETVQHKFQSAKEGAEPESELQDEKEEELVSEEESTDSAKRKSSDMEEEEVFEDKDESLNSKQRRKAKRRKLKFVESTDNITTRDIEEAERKDRGEDQQEEENSTEPEVPFNAFEYSSAPSVLNKGKDDWKKKQKKKFFNPYSHADEGPKGAKKRRGPSGGRSVTYKR
ncbi:exosome complex exonuclease Rrp6p [Trichomonascus vanleenenianus]|uniref:exosome nuclease subunit RRP6 n=1 Tax=Trichomonascus vanleenenianus TaxID=2268995 RepID=UPI003EC9FE56